MKKLLTLFTLLLTVCSGAWGAAGDSASDPATKTLNGQVFLDVANTPYNATITSGTIRCVTYGIYYLCAATSNGWRPSWVGGATNNMSSGTSSGTADFSAQGFLPGAQSNLSTAAERAVASGYGYSTAKQADNNTRYIYVTGITGVAMLNKDDSNESRNCILKVEEYNQAGTATTDLGTTTSGNNTSYHVTEYDAATLSGDKYYKITLSGSSSGGGCGQESQIRFTKYSAPASYTVTYKANGGTGTIADGTGTDITLSDGTGFTAPANYSFAGWNTANDGSGSSYAAGQTNVNADLDLFATWTQDGTIDANTGSANTTYTATLNATSIDVATAPTKSGYTLTGYWTAATDGTKIANADGTLVANTSYTDENGKWTNSAAAPTLYAQWAENVAPTAGIIYSYTITSSNVSTYDGSSEATPELTATGGTCTLNITTGKNNNKCEAANEINVYTYGGNSGYMKLVLSSGNFEEGDLVSIYGYANNADRGFYINTSDAMEGLETSHYANANTNGTVTAILDAGRANVNTLYIKRVSGGMHINSITITRNNSITLNNVDGAANGFSTFCSPNNFTVSGATAYKASLADNKLTLTEVTGVIPANEGVILAGTKGATATIAYTNNTATAEMEGNDLKGTTARVLTSTLKGEYAHFLAFQKTTNTFKEYNGTNFPANKAYVVTNDTEGREFEMIFGEQENDEQGTETDGIAGVEAEKNANVAYNLAGQKVGKDYKGIVIVNGKKVIRK